MTKKLPRCKVQRCKRIARIGEWCKTHAVKEADRVFSLVVRGYGDCYGTSDFWIGPDFKCAGQLQCCHLFSRRYRNVRWHADNAVPLCAAHHRWLDLNPLEKDEMMRQWLLDDYEPLRQLALSDADWRLTLEGYLAPDAGVPCLSVQTAQE